uniref:DUF4201 domain-containing protein n=1 Tax=Mesocestoides corti TaxID=53468 RepID=A0A5K3EMN9_MESCO
MSKLEEIVHDISFTVEKLTTRISEEKEKIKTFRESQRQFAQKRTEILRHNEQLRSDIEHLENSIFREVQRGNQLTKVNDLVEKR